MLPTKIERDRQTNNDENITSLAEVIKRKTLGYEYKRTHCRWITARNGARVDVRSH